MSRRVVVAGGGAAGLNAALKLSREGLRPVLVDTEKHHTNTDRLHRVVEKDLEDISINLEDFLKKTRIRYVDSRVEEYRPDEKVVETEDESLEYDNLVLAVPGETGEQDFSLEYTENFYTAEASMEAAEALEDSGEVAVIGAGRKGSTVASYLEMKGYNTTVVERKTRPLPGENSEASEELLSYFNKAGVGFRGGSTVKEIANYGIEFEDGIETEYDAVIWCGGLKCSEQIKEDFDCGSEGLEVNQGLSAPEHDGVYATGACIEGRHSFHEEIRQGRLVAENITSGKEMLKQYNPSKRKFMRVGKKGLMMDSERAFLTRLGGLYPVYRDGKYFTGLKYQRLRS